jgi:UDP-glucose 4-epimerase
MSAAKKSVLVTGASGFVGTSVVKHLQADSWSVIPLVRSAGDSRSLKIDFESPSFFSNLSAIPRVDAIVHLATNLGFCGKSLEEVFLANIAATTALITLARHMGAHFVFASSALIAGSKERHIGKSTPANPDSPYYVSKLLAEQIIQASGVRQTILRIGGVFGMNGPTHLGLNRAIRSVIEGEAPVVTGNGSILRNYIYVNDVAAIIADVLRRDIFGTHLVAGSEILSINEMLSLLCEFFLPGVESLRREGNAGSDQLIENSPDLLHAYSFRAALEEMRAEAGRCG